MNEINCQDAERIMKKMMIKYLRYIKDTYGMEGIKQLRSEGTYFPSKAEMLAAKNVNSITS